MLDLERVMWDLERARLDLERATWDLDGALSTGTSAVHSPNGNAPP